MHVTLCEKFKIVLVFRRVPQFKQILAEKFPNSKFCPFWLPEALQRKLHFGQQAIYFFLMKWKCCHGGISSYFTLLLKF